MKKMSSRNNDSKELNTLKNNIGFGMAFKATLGFYAAQFLATVLILGTIGLFMLGVVLLLF